MLRLLRDDERTRALPLPVLTRAHSPCPPNGCGDGGSRRAPVTSNVYEKPSQRLGLRRGITTGGASPEHNPFDSPHSPYGFVPKSTSKMCYMADVGDRFLGHHKGMAKSMSKSRNRPARPEG